MRMKAALWTEYGKIQLRQVDMPVIGQGEVLIKVKAAGVCATDLHVYTGQFRHASPPHILGHEIMGEVVAASPGVDSCRPGDRVVVETSIGCGSCDCCRSGMRHLCAHMEEIGFPPHQGGYAEYVKAPANNIVHLPPEISDAEGGIMESVVCPMGALMRNGVRMGETVAVFGVGPAGIAFIQGARALGAGKIIAVARNPQRLERARGFGADVLINSAGEDAVARLLEETGGAGVDLVCEAAGVSDTIRQAIGAARRAGRVILYGLPMDRDTLDFPVKDIITKQLELYGAVNEPRVWKPLVALVSAGRINLRDMVTHSFPLEKINDAFALLENKQESPLKIVVKP